MEVLVFAIIIGMVVNYLNKNAKEAKKRDQARQKGLPSQDAAPPTHGNIGHWMGKLEEWAASQSAPQKPANPPAVHPLYDAENAKSPEGKSKGGSLSAEYEAQQRQKERDLAQQRGTRLPVYQKAAQQVQSRMRLSVEGCDEAPEDCTAPHAELIQRNADRAYDLSGTTAQRKADRAYDLYGSDTARPLAFLDNAPEMVKGVVYAEILTRPTGRRRLRR